MERSLSRAGLVEAQDDRGCLPCGEGDRKTVERRGNKAAGNVANPCARDQQGLCEIDRQCAKVLVCLEYYRRRLLGLRRGDARARSSTTTRPEPHGQAERQPGCGRALGRG